MTWLLEEDVDNLRKMLAFHEWLLAIDKAIRCRKKLEVGRGRGKPVENCAVLREEDFVDLERAYSRLSQMMGKPY